MRYKLGLLTVIAAFLVSPSVYAQSESELDFGKRWEGRLVVNVNGGLQTLSPNLAYEHVDNYIFSEMSGGVSIPGVDGAVLDVTAGLRLFGNLGLSVTYAKYHGDQLGDLTSTFDVPGFGAFSDQIQVRGLSRTENTVHIDAIYVIPFTPRVQLSVFGGPSYFNSKQDVLNDYHFDTYGWDPSEAGVFTYYPEDGAFQSDSGSAWGYNVGVDLNYFFTRNIGVGFNTRYSAASIDYQNPIDQHEIAHGFRDPSLQQVVTLETGGLQFAGGVRFRF